MDMLSYLLGKNNGGGNPAKRFDYIIDARNVIYTTSNDMTITNENLLAQLNQIVPNIIDTENELVKPLKIGIYISGNNQEGYDNAFIESIFIEDCTNYTTNESQRNGYLAFRIGFYCHFKSSPETEYMFLDYVDLKTSKTWNLIKPSFY